MILAARSPVFASMFEHNMQERSNSKVNLTDVEPAIVKEMLVYMYSDRVSRIGEVAGDLLYVADKYQLENLKKICEEHLSSNLRVDNAARIIQLAYLHSAPQLKSLRLQFISDHGSEVRATQETRSNSVLKYLMTCSRLSLNHIQRYKEAKDLIKHGLYIIPFFFV